MFGERTSVDGSKARGWFPRCCVVEVSSCPDDNEEYTSSKSCDVKKTQWALSLLIYLLPWN